MNPMAAPSLLSLLPVAADAVQSAMGEAPEGLNFGALLADLGSPGASLSAASVQLPIGSPLPSGMMEPAAPANPLPPTGKILPDALPATLPGGLPLQFPGAARPDLPVTAPAPAVAESLAPQATPVKVAALALGVPGDQSPDDKPEATPPTTPSAAPLPRTVAAIIRRAAPATSQDAEGGPEDAPEEPHQAEPAREALALPVALLSTTLPLPANADTAPEARPSASAAPVLRNDVRSVPTEATPPAAQEAQDHSQPPAPPAPGPVAKPVFTAAAPHLTPQRTAVRVTIEPAPLPAPAELPVAAAVVARPVAPTPARQPEDFVASVSPIEAKSAASTRAKAALPDAPSAPVQAPVLAPVLAMTDVPQQPNPTLPASPAIEPRDFTALLDRLVAAREAMRGEQTRVSLALPHAEFGQVRLDFRHDERGLSVSMASSDPAFARAASTALPLAQSAAPADAGTRQGSEGQPRGQAEAQSFGQGAAQSRGGNQGGHNERQTRGQTFAQARPQTAATPDRSGIFA
mgnify:CR=1 FL=1